MKRFILVMSLPISLLLICGVIFGVLAFLESMSDKRETKTNRFNQLYSIEPESLLASLEQKKTSVFSPIDEEPPFPPRDQQIPVPWTQEDYLRIANALFELVWDGGFAGWQLNTMYFNLGCAESDVGFQSGIFTFLKNGEINKRKYRIERIINIDPRNKSVYVTEDEYSPSSWDWKVIDMAHLKVSADQAVQIAESNGGEEKRQSVANACYISLILSPSPLNDNGWIVSYTQTGELVSFFDVLIDPYTGEFQITK